MRDDMTSSPAQTPEPRESRRLRIYALSFVFVMWMAVLAYAVAYVFGVGTVDAVPALALILLLGTGVLIVGLLRRIVRDDPAQTAALPLSKRAIQFAFRATVYIACWFVVDYVMGTYSFGLTLRKSLWMGLLFAILDPSSLFRKKNSTTP